MQRIDADNNVERFGQPRGLLSMAELKIPRNVRSPDSQHLS